MQLTQARKLANIVDCGCLTRRSRHNRQLRSWLTKLIWPLIGREKASGHSHSLSSKKWHEGTMMVFILDGVTVVKAVLSSLDSKSAKPVGSKAWINGLLMASSIAAVVTDDIISSRFRSVASEECSQLFT